MRADYLNENSNSTNSFKKKVEEIGADRTLTSEDSGKVFACESSGGAVAITLPTTLENGVHYKFIVWEETPTADITIGAGSAIISMVHKDAGGDAAASTAGTQVSNVILDTTAQRGDYVNFLAWNGEWLAEAMSSINAGIHTS
tara:strand:+ start:187 stop:615 length:429 start_codon:yes stop_codon:yes gene_type:complete